MKIKIRHPKTKCWACKYQRKINKLCNEEDFGIEFDFFKDAGDIIPIISYTAFYKDKRIPLTPPFEVTIYKRNDPINLIPMLSDDGIRQLIKQVKTLLKSHKEDY